MKFVIRIRSFICGLLILGLCSINAAVIKTSAENANISGAFPIQHGIDETASDEDLAHYEQIETIGQLTMFADMEKGWFAVRNDVSGYLWYSHPNDVLTDETTTGALRQQLRSDLVVCYVFSNQSSGSVNYEASQSGPVQDKTVSVTRISGGIKVVYDFMSIGVRVPVTYTLSSNAFENKAGLKATVICSEILEGEDFLSAKRQEGIDEETLSSIQPGSLLNVWLLPAFGAKAAASENAASDDGYLFVPDGSGALADLNRSSQSEKIYDKMVYGEEAAIEVQSISTVEQNIMLPIFGTVHDNNALVGVITAGEGAASISAYKADPDCYYSGVGSKVHFRLTATTTLYKNQSNSREVTRSSNTLKSVDAYEVTYGFLSGDLANYSGMAQLYRRYMLDNGQLHKRVQSPSVVLDVLGAADITANFLGFSYKKTIPLTKFDAAADMIGELNSAGIDNVAVRYIGWNGGLLNRKMVTSAKPLALLGGKKGFQNLAKYMDDNDNPFYPDVDFLRFTKNGKGYKINRDGIQTVFGLTSKQSTYLRSTFEPSSSITPYMLLTPDRLPETAEKFWKSYDKLGISGISLSTISYLYYSDLGDKHLFYRSGLADIYRSVLQETAERDVAAQSANAYMLAYAQRVIDAPVNSSEEDIFKCSIPFYQLVTHGYVSSTVPAMNTAYDQQRAFLKAVETGSELYYTVMDADPVVLQTTQHNVYYNSKYSIWKDTIINQYNAYASLLKEIYDQPITMHTQLTEDVYCTVYENGISVIVNYGNEPYVMPDGQTVPAGEYMRTEGAENA